MYRQNANNRTKFLRNFTEKIIRFLSKFKFNLVCLANLWPKAVVEDPAECQIFLEAFFICNNINTNLNENFHTYLSYHSFKPLFLFFQISARNSFKKFENEKWPKAGYLPLCQIYVRYI